MLPTLPPLPICNVPALMAIPPPYVQLAARISVPLPPLVKLVGAKRLHQQRHAAHRGKCFRDRFRIDGKKKRRLGGGWLAAFLHCFILSNQRTPWVDTPRLSKQNYNA